MCPEFLEKYKGFRSQSAGDTSHSHFEKAEMCQTRATATSQRQKCARLEPQPLRKRQTCPRLEPQPLRKDRNASDSSQSHFETSDVRQTRAAATPQRQKCARLEPQPLRKDRNAPDSSHRHCAKTELHQTQAAATSKMQKCGSQNRNAPDSSHGHKKQLTSSRHFSKDSHSTDDCQTVTPRKEKDAHVGFSAPSNVFLLEGGAGQIRPGSPRPGRRPLTSQTFVFIRF